MKSGLLVGLDGVGKTLLLRQLALHLDRSKKSVVGKLVALATGSVGRAATAVGGGASDEASHGGATPRVACETQPTVGVEHTQLTVDTRTVTLCEVGGQLLPMWSAYFDTCDFWIFVVDLSNAPQIAGAAIELFRIMGNASMRKKPKLLLLNKMDACGTMPDTLLRSYLLLNQLAAANAATPEAGPLHIMKVSALTGQNIPAIAKWLSQRFSSAFHHHHHAHSSRNSTVDAAGNFSTRSEGSVVKQQ